MALKFGTSGLRGLVTEMTPRAMTEYTQAFLAACDCGDILLVGQDLRPSSSRIAGAVITAASNMGYHVVDCGTLPTPALALEASRRDCGAVMVTGSHIPADRNGLKFYTRSGEITKADEVAILNAFTNPAPVPTGTKGAIETTAEAAGRFIARYTEAFGADALKGRRIGLYAHSAVGRDLLAQVLTGLGAEVFELGRSATFIPVDTEAVDAETRSRIRHWVLDHGLDALVSTDGDSDRPLLADESGEIVPGDIMGQITAEALDAQVVVTPISSNSGVLKKGFETVLQTSIGSPYVIAGMQTAQGRVVGYEANGGFLLGFGAQGPIAPIGPLWTRDCILPLVVILCAAAGGTISARVATEPAIVTLSDRLQNISREDSLILISELTRDKARRAVFLGQLGQREAGLNLTDGLRMILKGGGIVHLRPSGNAPELRIYTEAKDLQTARDLLETALRVVREEVGAASATAVR